MRVKLKMYRTKENYKNETPDQVKKMDTITQALRFSKYMVNKAKQKDTFIGFRIFNDTNGKLRYKLPSKSL